MSDASRVTLGTSGPLPSPHRASAVRIAAAYAAVGAAWILGSDWLLHQVVSDVEWLTRLAVVKGWLYVAVTAGLLWVTLDRYFHLIRRATVSLQESEDRWRQALKGASQAVWDWNTETNEVHYSSEWKALLGHAPDEIGSTLSEWESRLHPDDLPRVLEEMRQHLEGHRPAYVSEHRLRRKDGSWLWVLDQGKVTSRRADGKPMRMVGTHADISERKRIEAELRRWADAFKHCAHGVAMAAEGSGQIQVCNPALARMLGRPPEKIAGTEILSLYVPEDHQRVLQGIADADRAGQSRYEARKIRADGTVFPAEVAVVSVRDDGGRVLYRIASFLDLTERREAEERARIQHDLMQALAAATRLDEGLRLCLEAAIRLVGLDSGGIYLLDPTTGALDLRVHRGHSAAFVQAVAHFESEAPQARAVAAGRPILVNYECLQVSTEYAALRDGLRSFVAVPMLHQGHPIGCLNVASHTNDLVSTAAVMALETIAAGAGQAIARLQAQEQLKSSEENFRTFFQTIDDLMVVATTEGKILFGNAALQQKLGYTADELAGLRLADLHPRELQGQVGTILAAVVRGESSACTLPLRRKDGELLPVDTRVWFGEWNGRRCIFGASKDLSAEQEAQLRFERLFRQNPLPMALIELPHHRFLDLNDAWLEVLGFGREESIGNSPFALDMLPQPELLERFVARLKENGSVKNVEIQVRTRTGAVRDGLFSAEIQPGHEQNHFLVAMVDITERKQAEEALRQRLELQDQLTMVAASVPGMICSFRLRPDGTTCMPFATDAIFDLYGLRPDDVRDDFSPVLAMVHPEDQQALKESIGESARTFLPWHGAFRVRHPRKGERWIEGHSVPRLELDGSILWHGFVQDATERKQAEVALRESEERFHAYVEQATDALFVHDLTGRFLEVNRQACVSLGYSREELLRMNVFDVDPSDDAPSFEGVWEAVPPGASTARQSRHRRRDGTTFPVEVHLSCFEVHGERQLLALVRDTTERMQAEEALRRSEAKYRIVSDNTFDWEFWLSPEGDYLYTSPSCERLTGHTPEEFGADANLMQRILHPEDLPRFQAHHRAALSGVKDDELEFRILRPDGEVRWIGHICAPIYDESGVYLGVRGSNRDITASKHAEAALRESETRFRALIENAPDGIALCSPAGILTYASPSACRLFGFEAARVREVNAVASTHPDDLPRVLAALEGLLRDPGQVPTLEYRFRRADGAWIWIESTFTNLTTLPGVASIVINFRSILDRKLAEEALAAEATRRRILIEGSRDGIVVLDQDGKVVEANRSFAKMLGYSAAEAHELHVWDWDRDWPRERVIEAIRDLPPGGGHFETRHWRKDGSVFPVEVSNSAAELAGQKLVFCVCHDLSERKRLESQLRQAQKLEAIGQLAGGVAHDFNNILAAILMQLGLLQMSATLDAETALALKDLETEAQRAAALTRQLLMFSRRSVLDVKPLDLNEVVKGLLKMLGRLIGEHIKLLFDGYTGALPSVLADAGMIEQSLMNLVVNARDAMPKGGRITITTTVEAVSEADLVLNADRHSGRFVCLAVSDTGIGMNRATLERIFEPFFTTKEPGKGTGLGLATVHGIVAQHKGWVEVESQVGQGTTFRVFLPAVLEPVAPAAVVPAAEPLQRGRETILLVEDESQVRHAVARGLRGLGYQVYEAENGQQAMDLWQKHGAGVDLLFTDMVMPEGMTGLELAERLRAIKPSLRVIVSSGYSAELVHAGGIKHAGIWYLPKPYQTQALADSIRACLDRRS